MRIVGGDLRGLRLADLGEGDEAARLRPTPDRVREAAFNLLQGGRFGDPVTGARVLDLFAGTGAMALEALSRGAAEAVLVDDGRTAARLIRDNLARARMGDRARLLPLDATRLPANDGAPFGLILLDPPYGRGLGRQALAAAQAGGWIAPGATLLWEEAQPMLPLPGLALLDRRRYGATWLTLLRAA
jgi:16S rRNA (guanine966-N2)-methyltransferase